MSVTLAQYVCLYNNKTIMTEQMSDTSAYCTIAINAHGTMAAIQSIAILPHKLSVGQ